MKRILALLLLLPLIAFCAVEYDLKKGIDLTGTNRISSAALNQLVDNGITATNRGMIIVSSTTPDSASNPRFTNAFLWLDISAGRPGTLKQYANGAWVASTLGVASITSAMLQEASVIAGKIAANGVNTTNLSDNSVTDTKINAGAVTSNKLATASVTSDKIVDGTIATVDIGTNTISTALLQDSSVTASKIPDGSIVSNKLASGAVMIDKLASSTVDYSKLTVTGTPLQNLRLNAGGTALEFAQPYCLQETRSLSNGLFTSTSVVAFDDTTITLAETTNILSATITPLRSDTFIIVEAVINFGVSGAAKVAAGIFRDAAGTASSAGTATCNAANQTTQIKLYSKYASTSTSATTFNIRLGQDSATVYVNGYAAARLFGGTCESWIILKEVTQ